MWETTSIKKRKGETKSAKEKRMRVVTVVVVLVIVAVLLAGTYTQEQIEHHRLAHDRVHHTAHSGSY